jgi:aspartate--ammonia ligase
MNAVRPDEELDSLHSLYVDQWDWERVISKEQRNLDFLKFIVKGIYSTMKRTEYLVYENYSELKPFLPDEIQFIHSEELLMQYPNLTPRERESKAAEKYGAIFVIGIGSKLANGEKHDGRAPDYDDWSTPTIQGYRGLNGDIVVWNPLLKQAFELSSMGIRVDKEALLYQLKETGFEERRSLYFHQRLLNNELPLSVGGGIGQSRLCMLFLRKAHVGETQASIWPEPMINECKKNGIFLM